MNREPSRHFLTFEGFFAQAVREELGPFVALGDPTDRLPPLGASRQYVPDASWEDELARLANDAQCILATPILSPNTSWEFSFIRRADLQEKLFLVTPPYRREAPTTGSHRAARAVVRMFATADLDNLRVVPLEPWEATRHSLESLGFRIAIPDPGPGAVLSFDSSGNCEVVRHSATSPAEYVQAIKARLAARQD